MHFNKKRATGAWIKKWQDPPNVRTSIQKKIQKKDNLRKNKIEPELETYKKKKKLYK